MNSRFEFVSLAGMEGANVSLLCRRFGISRQTGYKWLQRFDAGCEDFQDRSRRPLHQPTRTSSVMEAAVIGVRDAHPAWGARKIVHVLARQGLRPPAVSTVHAILRRHGRIGSPPGGALARHRFEASAPNRLWQMDFKGDFALADGSRCYPLTVLDDHSRYDLTLAACANQRRTTVKPLLHKTFRRYGLPEAFYLDNGAPWGTGVPGGWTRLGVWLLKLGVTVIHGRPHHPQGRGKIERFHRSLKAEVLAMRRFADRAIVQQAFNRWRTLYNHSRPHEALDMDVPASRYQPSDRTMPDTTPDVTYDSGEIVRKVGTTKAYVSFKNRLWRVPRAFQGETVAIRPSSTDGKYAICFGATKIATIDLRT